MNFKHLEYLIKIVECGSITKASQKLFISQPALTKAITLVEQDYGIQIFRRSQKGVVLTAEGENFIYYAKSAIHATNILEKTFRSKDKKERSHLSIAAQQQDFLYDILLKTYNSFTDMSLHYVFEECDRSSVAKKVLTRQASLGIFIKTAYDGAPLPWRLEEEKLDFFTLDTSNIYMCVGKKSPFWGMDFLTHQQAKTQPTLILSSDLESANALNLDTDFQSINTEKIVFCNSIECCRHFLLNTDMLLYTSKWTKKYLDDDNLYFSQMQPMQKNEKFANLPQIHELTLIKRKNTLLNSTEKNFIEKLANYFDKNTDDIF